MCGLEEDRIPLFDLMESSLRELDSLYDGHSYWVYVSFRRPVGKTKRNREAIRKSLKDFLSKPFKDPCDIEVTKRISFYIFSSQPVQGRVFRFTKGTDKDSGGWLLDEFIKNLNYCIEEKKRKIEEYKNKYTSWWLVVVDHIAYGFDDNEKEIIKTEINKSSPWVKIIVLDSSSENKVLEI